MTKSLPKSHPISMRFLIIFLVAFSTVFSMTPRQKNKQLARVKESVKTMLKAPPQWMEEEINSVIWAPQVPEFDEEIFFSALGMRVNIIDHAIEFKPAIEPSHVCYSRFLNVRRFFHDLSKIVSLPNAEFYIYLGDAFADFTYQQELGEMSSTQIPLPLLTFAKNQKDTGIFLMPDFEALAGYPGSNNQVDNGSKRFPWEKKKGCAFWRGTTTGGIFTKDNWDSYPRSQAVLISQAHPDLLQAHFSNLTQGAECIQQLKPFLAPYVAPADSIAYKYLIDIDGNSCTYSRCYWILLSNSVMLKQLSDNVQWYYRGLIPYVHFIPLENDLSNLIEQIQWAKNHDKECQTIAKQATRFAQENLTLLHHYCYMTLLINKLSRY